MRSSRAVLGALMALSRSDQDAVVLLTGNTVLTPALMTLIHRESTPLWSMRADVPER
jgi:hypothetical protein